MFDLNITAKASVAMLIALGALAGCQKNEEGPAEAAGKQIDQAIEKTGEKIDQATDTLGKSIEQAGQEMRAEPTVLEGKQ